MSSDVKVRHTRLSDYRQNEANPVAHNPRNLGAVVESVRKVGAFRSGAASKGKILAGNLTWEAMAEAGIEEVIEITTDGKAWVVVNRDDLTPEQERYYAYADERASELAEWNPEQVAADAASGMETRGLFSDAELMAILAKADTRAEYGFLDAIPTGDAPVMEQREQRGYPLAIVLSRDEYEAWGEAKQRLGVRDDKAALLALVRLSSA